MAFVKRLTTGALIREIRDLVDETNTSAVTDDEIVASLNRASDRVADILAKHYNAPLLTSLVQATGSTAALAIPEDALEQRVQKMEFRPQGGSWTQLLEVSVDVIHNYEQTIQSSRSYPQYYYIVGQEVVLLPGPAIAGQLRMWYLRDPAPLVKELGRITVRSAPGGGTPYVVLDEVEADAPLSAQGDELESFVNLVDKDSGRIKATLQVQALDDTRVTFRTVPTRSVVQGLTVVSSLPADLEVDDYACPVQGTCVPLFKKPASNYLVQYAAADVSVNKLGGDPGILLAQVSKMEEDVSRTYAGRPNKTRVKNRSNSWRPVGVLGWRR